MRSPLGNTASGSTSVVDPSELYRITLTRSPSGIWPLAGIGAVFLTTGRTGVVWSACATSTGFGCTGRTVFFTAAVFAGALAGSGLGGSGLAGSGGFAAAVVAA